MKVTKIITTKINGKGVSDNGKLVYRTMLKTGARTTEAIMQHLNIGEGLVNLALAELLRYDLVEVKV